MTREQLKALFANGHLVVASDFANLIDSLKAVQAAVDDPAANGTSTTFISNISQDTDGKITVQKKTVNFSGYQTTAGMSAYQTTAGMQNYQDLDIQKVDAITVGAGQDQTITHNKKHYPTVRLMNNATGEEVKPTEYTVKHASNMVLVITLGANLTGSYKYILD